MEKKNLEKESNKNEIALFKYAIIAPLVNDIYDSKSKEELNKEYNEYIASEYNSKYHSGIENIPRNRFQKDYDRIKFIDSKEEVEKIFLHIEEKPVAADSTIRLGGKDFEVPQKYIKQRILIKYAPEDLSKAYIYDSKTKELEEIKPVDKIANSKIKRKNISYN